MVVSEITERKMLQKWCWKKKNKKNKMWKKK